MKVNKTMIKEAMENMPEVEDSLKGVVDPVMAKAKLDAEKNKKHFDEVVPSANELDRKKSFLGAEKQPEPEEAEKELDSLEEEVIEDKAEAKKYLHKIVGNTKGYFTEKLALSEDLFEDDQIEEEPEEDLELGNKEALLREYNLEGALSSPEAKQKAIDKCNQILNILNNTEVESTEIPEDDFTDDAEISGDSVETEMTSTEDYYEESLNTHKHIHESFEDEVACEWCGEMTPVGELRNTDYGCICDYCIQAIKSYGEPISINYNSECCDNIIDCPDCIEEDYNLVGQDGNAFALMGYTANAMRECGIADEIGEMRERAMSSDYNNLLVVCNEYIQKCNELIDRFDDDYVVEGLEFAADTSEIMEDVDEFPLPEVGQKIRIIKMEGEPHYDGREGVIKYIDALKQLNGSWGGLAVIPGVDEFEVIE